MIETRQSSAERTEIECLHCGSYRYVNGLSTDELGSCPICGYVGWASSESVTEAELKRLQLMHAELRFTAAS